MKGLLRAEQILLETLFLAIETELDLHLSNLAHLVEAEQKYFFGSL